jgi:ABC-type nitrate/sulfonate/bicarbonate transport system substrate-binding protein
MVNPANQKITRKTIIIFTVLLILMFINLLTAGCETTEPEELETVTVILDWTPNTNFSGIYAAIERGYYREEGLSVELVQAPGSVIQMVGANQAEFGFSYQEEVTFARLADIPVVSVAAVIQHNSSGFISLKERGIETPADFEGKSYGGWGSPVEEATIKALMERHGANFEKVNMITTGEVDALIAIEREADFAWIFYGWTGIAAELKGMNFNFIELRSEDSALDYYTPVLISSETTIASKPDLVERFMSATAKGYRLAIEKPDEAAQILLDAVPELNPKLVQTSQKWLANQYQADAQTWGLQQLETWEAYGSWLFEHGLIDEIPVMENAFTNEFLE